MKPQIGDFWIVEAFGEVTIGQCQMETLNHASGQLLSHGWRLFNGATVRSPSEDFRAVRKIDIDALLDGDPVTVTSLSRLVLGLVVQAGGSVTISAATQENTNPAEWRTNVMAAVATGDILVEAVKVEPQKHTDGIINHPYEPDNQAMGDCRVCGGGQSSPWHD